VAVAAAVLLGTAARSPAPHPSPFLAAAEEAPSVVSGSVAEVRAVDLHGFAATLTVERSLVGSDAPGAVVRIAWEQLARGAPARLEDGSRVLVSLAPLPSQSLWRRRFPAGGVRVIAREGAGVIPAPDEPTVAALERFLSLAGEDRESGAGVEALSDLSATAPPPLALAAVARLDAVPDLASRVSPAAASVLSRVAGDPARPVPVRVAVLDLAGQRGLSALRPAAAAAAEGGPPLDVQARYTLAALDGGIPAAQLGPLLQSEEPSLRVLAIRHAQGTPAEASVASAIGSDPAPEVRIAAVQAWCEWHGVEGAREAEPALFDPAPSVRGAAAESLGGLGESLVPRWVELANAREGGDAAGPVWALRHAGPAGIAALRGLAANHPDERVRKLARLASGKPLAEH